MQLARCGTPASVVALLSHLLAGSSAHAAASTVIYRCVESDVVTYSDRPCGPSSKEYEWNEARISILEVELPATTKPARARPKPARTRDDASIAAAQAKRTEQCTKLERSLREVRSKMRAGYDAKEGERLKERQRKLVGQQRELRC